VGSGQDPTPGQDHAGQGHGEQRHVEKKELGTADAPRIHNGDLLAAHRWSSPPARWSSLPACPMRQREYRAAPGGRPDARATCYPPVTRRSRHPPATIGPARRRARGAPMPDRYAAYPSLQLERPGDGVLRVVMSAPGRLNAAGPQMHRDLAGIWTELDRDPEVRAVVVRGAGDAFSAGGDLDLVAERANDFGGGLRVLGGARGGGES